MVNKMYRMIREGKGKTKETKGNKQAQNVGKIIMIIWS